MSLTVHQKINSKADSRLFKDFFQPSKKDTKELKGKRKNINRRIRKDKLKTNW